MTRRAHVARNSAPRAPSGSIHSKSNRRSLIDRLEIVRPLSAGQWPTLVLSVAGIHQTSLVNHITVLEPDIPRKASLPECARRSEQNRLLQPVLNIILCEVPRTNGRIRARSRMSGKRRRVLVFWTADISHPSGDL